MMKMMTPVMTTKRGTRCMISVISLNFASPLINLSNSPLFCNIKRGQQINSRLRIEKIFKV